jgi:hypothetical protein
MSIELRYTMSDREYLWARVGRFTVRGLFMGAGLGALYGTCIVPIIGTLFGAFFGGIVGFVLGAVNGVLLAVLMLLFADWLDDHWYPAAFALCNGFFSIPAANFGFSLLLGGSSSASTGTSPIYGIIGIPAFIAGIAALWTSYRINMSYLEQAENAEKPKGKPKRKAKADYGETISADPLNAVFDSEGLRDVS